MASSGFAAPRRSAPRRPAVADVVCLGAIGLNLASGTVLLFLTAYLLPHALLHELLTGSISALVTAGAFVRDGRLPWAAAVPAGLIGFALFDPFYWWAGRRYGEQVTAFAVRRQLASPQRVARGERLVARYGVWVVIASPWLPLPNSLIFVVVGASGLPLWQFLLADLIGALSWVGVLLGLGYAIGRPAVHVAHAIGHDALLITVAVAVVLGVVNGVRTYRRERRREG